MPFCVVFLWQLYHYERKWGTTTCAIQVVQAAGLYHYERKWGTTTHSRPTVTAGPLYHYERKWGTMAFCSPMSKNDFLHIISPFSACVNPQTEGAGVAGCPGGFGICLTKGETLGKLEPYKI